MNPVEPILRAHDEGHPALLLSGRSLYDFVTDDGRLRPFMEVLRRTLFRKYGMVFITYSLANGLQWFESWIANESDRHAIREVLRSNHLLDITPSANEVVSIIRGFATLLRSDTKNLQWKDGRPMRFAVCLEFSEHLVPSLANGTQTDNQMIVTELVHITSQSLALRDSGNLIFFHGRDGLIDELVCTALHHIRLPLPNETEKKDFIESSLELYSESSFEIGLTKEAVVSLTVNTPNRGLESLLRASHRGRRQLAAKEIAAQKNRDVEQLSEGTLTPLDTARVCDLHLVGKNIAQPQAILERLAEYLVRGDSSMPANVLLAGAPGTAKTDLALLVAHQSKSPAYQMLSPKGGIVGETERKARLQQTALKEWTPNVAFVDEITEAFPLERSDFDGDSGASRAVTAALLTSLSDETRRGKSLLIATTNSPWRMGAAMRSRFVILPVLQPLKEDYADIIAVTASRISSDSQIDKNDKKVKEAADVFYSKGANPRHIRVALSNALMLHKTPTLSSELVLFAAHDLCATTDLPSAIYADLWAIQACSSKSFLPWSDNPQSYPFPSHLQELVDSQTGDLNEQALLKRIEEYKQYANV